MAWALPILYYCHLGSPHAPLTNWRAAAGLLWSVAQTFEVFSSESLLTTTRPDHARCNTISWGKKMCFHQSYSSFCLMIHYHSSGPCTLQHCDLRKDVFSSVTPRCVWWYTTNRLDHAQFNTITWGKKMCFHQVSLLVVSDATLPLVRTMHSATLWLEERCVFISHCSFCLMVHYHSSGPCTV